MSKAKLRMDEVYTSIQGEGPHVGKPVQFVRFAGCNLKCPLWPCDTQHAIDPVNRKDWYMLTPEELFEVVEKGPRHVVLTGGEPFLQNEAALAEFAQLLGIGVVGNKPRYRIEAFTNGTLEWPLWAYSINKVFDWKLPGSGEGDVGHDNRIRNMDLMNVGDSLKFTCADYEDFRQATIAWEKVFDPMHKTVRPQTYVGAAWGKSTEAEVAEWLIDSGLPWKLNVQMHNFIWDREKRGI